MSSATFLALHCTATFLTYTLIYRLFFHPLRHVPGFFFARLTNLWLIWHVRKGRSHTFFPKLHAQYGPIVRIAPDQVLLCGEDGIKAVYGVSTKFTKGAWYRIASAPEKARQPVNEVFHRLIETHMEKCRRQRRAIGPAYSVAGCEQHEGLLDTYLGVFVEKLKSLEGQDIELAAWGHIFALDAIL
jgi:hypothetical protein